MCVPNIYQKFSSWICHDMPYDMTCQIIWHDIGDATGHDIEHNIRQDLIHDLGHDIGYEISHGMT